MKLFIVACCNSACRWAEFYKLVRLVRAVPGVKVNLSRHCVTQGDLTVRFVVALNRDASLLDGSTVVGLHTCGNPQVYRRGSHYLEAARVGMKGVK